MQSMTGFGRGEYSGEGFQVRVEVKSLNHRFLEIICRLPRRYQILEERIRREVQNRFHRGRFEIQARVFGVPPDTARLFVDRGLLDQYLLHLRSLAAEYDLAGELSAGDLLHLREIFIQVEETPEIETLWSELAPALEKALEEVARMREKEGTYLREILLAHLQELDRWLAAIAERKENHLREAHRRLEERLQRLLADKGLDPMRLHQEAAILADRLDFSEELDRLYSHLRHFKEIMAASGPHGRKLDFLCQEMFREINTLSHKASSAEISHLAVEVKSVIEKVREQVQNLE